MKKKLDIYIRTAKCNDVDARTITLFQMACAKESENRELSQAVVLDTVRRILVHNATIIPGLGQYMIVEDMREKKAIACCLLQHQVSEWTGGIYLNIESVYVHSEYRGKGILQALLAHIEEGAKKLERITEIRLCVAETNKPMHWALEKVNITKSKYVIFSKSL